MIKILFIFIIIGLYLYYRYTNKSTTTISTYISKSSINGEGLFSNKNFKKDDIILDNIFPYKDSTEILYNPISKSIFNNYISKEGTKINHCSTLDNSYIYTDDYKIYKLLALKDISNNVEITCNYDNEHTRYPFIAGSRNNYNIC